ncbi:RnfH family protein [Noviherbaspirillum sp. ST9]|uniref:RnfH family protein n=1 Tax=Noviherbaspirillum sp. ST9 TaxID=3401606 RepID=UPI003B58756B
MADISVQVCYARPDRQILLEVKVNADATIKAAIEQSGMLREVPEIDLDVCKVGVYGKLKPLDAGLRERDRVEIYRPLIADPMESRRKRAEKKSDKKAR